MAILVAVVVFAIILLTTRSRRQILGFLVGASAGLIAAQIFQVHVFTILVILWAILSPRESRKLFPLQAVMIIVAAAVLASTALFGQLVNNANLGLQLLAFAISAAILVVTASARDAQTMLYGLLSMTSLASMFGGLQVVGIAPNDAWHLDVSALGRPTGFYPEPDWLGMFSGIGLVLAWRLPLKRSLRMTLITVNAAAWVLAFARAGWVAMIASSLFAFTIFVIVRHRSLPSSHSRKPSGRLAASLLTVVGGLIAVFSVPQLQDDLMRRLSRTLTVSDGDISAQARVLQNNGLQYLADTAPWYGWGLSSSGRVGVSGRLQYGVSDNNLGSNWLISMWVDGAWLSLPLIALLVLAFVLAAPTVQGQLLLLVLLNSFFSNATFQPITWLLVGLCLAHSRRKSDNASPPFAQGQSQNVVHYAKALR